MPVIREVTPGGEEGNILKRLNSIGDDGSFDYDDVMSFDSNGAEFFEEDDDDDDCTYCTCEKHKKILSFMDACVKLGFQLLSSDFEKSFKPLLNALHSGQKATPVKQLTGVAMSVKRVCNYALEQSAPGYIEKFKKFIQKEMDTDADHIDFLIETHFEMRENFDCYCKNFSVLLHIASQLNPAYDDAVLFKVNTKCFKENQAVERFLKTQIDIKSALVHYERVLDDIKERFEENHSNLCVPEVSRSIRSLMEGSLWVPINFQDCEKDSADLEDKLDFELLDWEQHKSDSSKASPVRCNNALHGKSKSKKKEKAPPPRRKGDLRLEMTMVTTSCIEKTFSFSITKSPSENGLVSKKKSKKNGLINHDRSDSSGRDPKVNFELKLKNSCSKRNFECCAKKTSPKNAKTDVPKKKGRQKKNTETSESASSNSDLSKTIELPEVANTKTTVDNQQDSTNKVSTGIKKEEKSKPSEVEPESEPELVLNDKEVEPETESTEGETQTETVCKSTGFKAEDFVTDLDEIGIEELSEFITVSNKKSGKSSKQKSGELDSKESFKKSDWSIGSDESSRSRPKGSQSAYSSLVEVLPPQTAIEPPENTVPNSMTISQKMHAFMSSEALGKPGVVTEPPKAQNDMWKDETISAVVGSAVKQKPISKPVATVDPCKVDNTDPAVTVACDKESVETHPSSLFAEASGINGVLEQPFRNYSPLDGLDRLRPVQDSVARYTNNSTPNTDASDRNYVPTTKMFTEEYFSSLFPPPPGAPGSDSATAPGFEPLLPGFGMGSSDKMPKELISPESNSTLNPTAHVFSPTPKEFFPSANPLGAPGIGLAPGTKPDAGSPVFRRSNSVGLATSLGIDEHTGNLRKDVLQQESLKMKPPRLSKSCQLQQFKAQMHLSIRLLNAELSDTRSRTYLLRKLETFVDAVQKSEILEILQELDIRQMRLCHILDETYAFYKESLLMASKSQHPVKNDSFPAIRVNVPVLSNRVHKFFNS